MINYTFQLSNINWTNIENLFVINTKYWIYILMQYSQYFNAILEIILE